MTKKDYKLIAEVIKKEAETWDARSLGAKALSSFCIVLTDALQKNNPKFNADKFMRACYPEN